MKVKVSPIQAVQAQKKSIAIALLILSRGGRTGWVVKAKFQLLYPQEKVPLRIVQQAEWDSGPVWTAWSREKYPAPTRV